MNSSIYILLITCILLSGIFSGAEIAIFSLSQATIRALVDKKTKGARALQKLKSHPQQLLIAILIGNNLVNISASSLATLVAIQRFGSMGVGIATGVMTFLILLFGEILPKSISQKNAVRIALFITPFMRVLVFILYPIVSLLHFITVGFQRIFHVKDVSSISEDDVRAMVNLSHEEGSLEQGEKEMIEKVFLLNDITAEDVMTPAEYIIGFSMNTIVRDAISVMYHSGHSRFPIFSVREKNVEGIIYLKDVFTLLSQDHILTKEKKTMEEVLNMEISSIMKPALFVPEVMHVDDLMHDLRKRHIHIAIVVDEHGVVQGLVTLEDLLEEIVGEIVDETDVHTNMIERIDATTIIVDPRITVGHVNTVLKTALPCSRQKTIGWLALKHFGRIPKKEDAVTIHDHQFIVEEAEEHRMKRVKIIKTAKARLQ